MRLHKSGSPMIRSCTSVKLNNNLANLLKTSFKNKSQSLFDFKLCKNLFLFVLKGRLFYSTQKLAIQGNINEPKQF